MYNSQLFPANNGEAKTQLALNESSELVAEENLPKQDDGTTLNNTMIALEVSYTDPTVNKTLSGVIDKVHKQALHNKFKKLEKSYCTCEEYSESDKKLYKIRYIDITTIDGMQPQELAAVYGLAPKTQRFKSRRTD